jgi:hypothetical protein
MKKWLASVASESHLWIWSACSKHEHGRLGFYNYKKKMGAAERGYHHACVLKNKLGRCAQCNSPTKAN